MTYKIMSSINSDLLPSMMVDMSSPTPYTDAITVSFYDKTIVSIVMIFSLRKQIPLMSRDR